MKATIGVKFCRYRIFYKTGVGESCPCLYVRRVCTDFLSSFLRSVFLSEKEGAGAGACRLCGGCMLILPLKSSEDFVCN